MKIRIAFVIAALILTTLLPACSLDGWVKVSEGEPDIVGEITEVQNSTRDDISGQILVEMDESDGTSDKYWVGIKPDTTVNDYRGDTPETAAFADLAIGQEVQVWFGSPVRESYPAQVDARRIDITR